MEDNKIKKFERYTQMALEIKQKRENIYNFRIELENIKNNNLKFEEARKIYRKDLRANLEKAIKDKDYTKAYQIKEKIAKQGNTNKLYLKVNANVEKINRLNVKSLELQEKIDKRLDNIAKREMEAKGFISQKIADFKNSIDEKRLKYQSQKLERLEKTIQQRKEDFNHRTKQDKDYKTMSENKDIKDIYRKMEDTKIKSDEVSKNIDEKRMSDYKKLQETQNGNKIDVWEHKTSKVKIIDKGNTLIAKGGTEKEKAQALLKVAKEKGWNLSKLEITGSQKFKEEVQKILDIQKQKQQEMIKKLEEQKQLQKNNLTKEKSNSKEKSLNLQK